ncbi:MAG: hypothetical protein LUI60_05545 [Clostridia bacterium]|nr:hypothetical protein [Clostridia bacterium]
MKVFIGFDKKNKNIRILKADKGSEVDAYSLRFQATLFSEQFIGEFQSLLTEFIASNNIPRNTSAYLVMPDSTVGFETFDLPYMNKTKMLKALETELTNEYGTNLKDKKISRFVITSTHQFTTYGVVIFDRNIIMKLNKVLYDVKLFPRAATYDGNSVVNSVLHFMPRSRGKSFVVADIRKDCTEIAVCSRGKTMGVANIPHGTDIINSPEVCDEYSVTDHTAADIAVINAREIAKAKTLTMSEEEQPASEVAEETSPVTEETVKADVTDVKPDETEDELEDEDFTEEEAVLEQPVQEQFVLPNAPKSKVYRKTKRRLPKFMQREVPETPEGIAYENFRIILKWILLYARQAHMTEYLNDPEYIVINLPEELHYLIDMANEEQGEGGVPIRQLKGTEKRPAVITANMDLYGASFTGSYNHNHNFFKVRFFN